MTKSKKRPLIRRMAAFSSALLLSASSVLGASAPSGALSPTPLSESPSSPLPAIESAQVPLDSPGSRVSAPLSLPPDDPYLNPVKTRTLAAHHPDAPFVLSPRPEPDEPEPPTPPPVTAEPAVPPAVPTAGLPENGKVDPSYFADALFVGDSRTVGLSLYSGISSTYYADTGLNVLTVLSKPFLTVEKDGVSTKATVLDAVALSPSFNKVYIAFGINEIGWPSVSSFIGSYEYLLTELQKLMPDAVFYVQGIIPVSQAVVDSGYIKNTRVAEYNALLAELADKHSAHFIDLTGLYAEAGGVLTSDISSDGIHLNRKGVEAYMDWLMRHTA